MSDATRRRGAEAALVAIAAVWGLTFVMVQDAIALLRPPRPLPEG